MNIEMLGGVLVGAAHTRTGQAVIMLAVVLAALITTIVMLRYTGVGFASHQAAGQSTHFWGMGESTHFWG